MPSLILGKGIHHIPLIKPIHNPCSENQELRSGHVPHQLHINASNPHEVVVELRKLFAKHHRPGQGSRFEGERLGVEGFWLLHITTAREPDSDGLTRFW